jgi:hypothetical protein
VRVIWRDSWAIHGIGLLSLTKTDSANFPSDFNLPVVISLLDYQDEFTQIKNQAKKWPKNIKDRAKSLGPKAFLLRYSQGYQLYSSLEHADVMALSGYIQDESETSLLIGSAPSDDYVGLVLAHNFLVMADLLIAAMNYFGIQRLDIQEKLTTTWEGFNRDGIERQ